MARTLSFHGSRRPQPMPVRASRSASRPDAQAARAGFESKDRARFRPSIGRHTRDAVATTPTGRKTPPGRTRKSRSVRRRLCDEPGFTAGTSLDLSARSAKRPLGDSSRKTDRAFTAPECGREVPALQLSFYTVSSCSETVPRSGANSRTVVKLEAVGPNTGRFFF